MTAFRDEPGETSGMNPSASSVPREEVNRSANGVVNPPEESVNPDSPGWSVYKAAQTMYDAGLNVVPVRMNGSKMPELAKWQKYQSERTTREQLFSWFASGQHTGVGILYGKISGNIELIEFEGEAIEAGVFDDISEIMQASGLGDLWDRICIGWVGGSPSGGMHFRVRVTGGDVPPNTRLACRPRRRDELTEVQIRMQDENPDKVFPAPLIETRGEGGFGVVEPSHGRVHPSGLPYRAIAGSPHTIPSVTIDELRAVHDVLRMADQMPKKAAAEWRGRPQAAPAGGGLRPGDDFNGRGDVAELLNRHGWSYLYSRGEESFWCRPGKQRGVSATLNYRGSGKLYVFTSSTEFDNEKSYTPFAVYAMLEHAGKYGEAAKSLSRQGFGESAFSSDIPAPRSERTRSSEPMWGPEDSLEDPVDLTPQGDDGNGGSGGSGDGDNGEGGGGPRNGGEYSNPDAPMRVSRELEHLWVKKEGRTLHHWRDTWMTWDGTRYKEVGVSALKSKLYLKLEHAFYYVTNKDGVLEPKPWNPSTKKIANLIDAISAVTHLDETFEPGQWLNRKDQGRPISCKNVLVDPITRQTRAHTPAFFTTVSVPYDYDPEAQCPQWLAFLDDVFEDDPESIETLQEWAGYVVSGRTELQKGMQLIGPPRAGKGTVARIQEKLIGKENRVGTTLKDLGTNFGLQPLIGKSLCVVGDGHMENRNASQIVARLLMITGEDSITVDRKNRAQWDGKMSARVMILANKPPKLQDSSGAIVDRFITLTFTKSFLGREDHTLETRLTTELAGIFNWALDGLARLTERGYFRQPSSSAEMIDNQRQESAPIQAFIREMCVSGSEQWITKEAMFQHWQGWCYRNNIRNVGTTAAFAQDLYAAQAGIKQTRRRITGRLTYLFTGITVATEPGMVATANQSHAVRPEDAAMAGLTAAQRTEEQIQQIQEELG